MTERLTLVVDNDFTRGNREYARGILSGRRLYHRLEQERYEAAKDWPMVDEHFRREAEIR